jgi:Glycosyl transferases group 1
MKIYVLHDTGNITYPEYIGIVTLRRVYPEITFVSYGKGVNKYLEALLKIQGISLTSHSNRSLHDLGDDFTVVNPFSITLGKFAHLREPSSLQVDQDGYYLFEGDEFPSKDLLFIEYTIPQNMTIDEKFVATSESNYAKLVRELLPERVWNPTNQPIWGIQMENRLPLRRMDKRFKFHVLGLVHLPTSEEYMSCAFTQKNVKLCKMLVDMGHEVVLYGAEGSTAPCTQFVQTHTLKDIRDSWGEGDNRFQIGYDWKTNQFKHDFNSKRMPATEKYYLNAIAEIQKTKKPDDFLLVTQGFYQKPIGDAVGLYLTCEPGIGYRGSYARFRAFESSYIQYFTYGGENPRGAINGSFYDRVIPNYYDTKDFSVQSKKGDYYLFMGRLIIRKGLEIAIKTVEAIGGRLVVAGQIDPETSEIMKNPVIDYIGYADAKKRAELMSGARAVFTPSMYLEPFCGVHAEAMLCGTPVITTNFGAFTDYVIDGLNGFKCNTLQDFVDAARLAETLDPKVIRSYAKKFTLDSVRLEYQRWFQDLYRIYESIEDSNKKAWHHLS